MRVPRGPSGLAPRGRAAGPGPRVPAGADAWLGRGAGVRRPARGAGRGAAPGRGGGPGHPALPGQGTPRARPAGPAGRRLDRDHRRAAVPGRAATCRWSRAAAATAPGSPAGPPGRPGPGRCWRWPSRCIRRGTRRSHGRASCPWRAPTSWSSTGAVIRSASRIRRPAPGSWCWMAKRTLCRGTRGGRRGRGGLAGGPAGARAHLTPGSAQKGGRDRERNRGRRGRGRPRPSTGKRRPLTGTRKTALARPQAQRGRPPAGRGGGPRG